MPTVEITDQLAVMIEKSLKYCWMNDKPKPTHEFTMQCRNGATGETGLCEKHRLELQAVTNQP